MVEITKKSEFILCLAHELHLCTQRAELLVEALITSEYVTYAADLGNAVSEIYFVKRIGLYIFVFGKG